jgi:(1->4)-alpha-D-glucan 1-alpha-D-glucosylmutase
MSPSPRATYRLQLREGIGLAHAAALAAYLRDLGISHLYTSPAQTAVEASSHGYDVTDPTAVDPALGGEAGHRALSKALAEAGLGRLVDIVPNHLAAHPSNPWWADLIEQGEASPFAHYFDVDWEAGGGRIVEDPVEPNYRRFFDISGLAGVRVEDPEVLTRTHQLTLQWLEAGDAYGLRVDHPDGLRDPADYFADLRGRTGGAWTVVEKILAPDEELPSDWEVDGTTGYEFCRRVFGLHVDPRSEERFTRTYAELTAEEPDWDSVSRQSRLDVLDGSLAGDLNRLARVTADGAADLPSVKAELADRLAGSRVYRRYPDSGASDSDLRFEQLCAAVTAKGVEDTAFYRYTRFVALNEVGSDPGRWGCTPEEFHAANRQTLERWPLSLTATATHDTKWGEDVRARLCVLSEVPDEWIGFARRWMADDRLSWLEAFTAYGLLQALVGAWPLPFGRAESYLRKAMREAKGRTSWTSPDEAYEAAAVEAIRNLLDDPRFEADLSAFARPLAAWGRVVSLATLALKLMSPGVPDIYQGTEVWDDSLVDPDNRRPVPFDHRAETLQALGTDGPLAGMVEGHPKFRLLRAGLALRASRPDSFGSGSSYSELEAEGPGRHSVVAFSRSDDVLVAAPRLLRADAPAIPSARVELPAGDWTDVITGAGHRGSVSLADLWSGFPVAVLRQGAST